MSHDAMQVGIEALRAGRKREARRLFGEIVQRERDNAAAWWFLSAATDEPHQKVECLRQVIRLEPGHTAAYELLRSLEPQVAAGTPGKGTPRPVLDVAEQTGGYLAIQENTPLVTVPPKPTPKPRRLLGWLALLAMVLVSAAIMVGLIRSGFALRAMNIQTPTPQPTLIPFQIGVPDCLPDNQESAKLVFDNQTGMKLDLLQGPEGREAFVVTIGAGNQEIVETEAAIPVRYAVRSGDPAYAISGAVIEIPAASACRVVIKK